MLGSRWVVAAALLSLTGGVAETAASAAEPLVSIRALRTRVFVLRKGDPEVVQTGQLSDTVTRDRLIVLFLGTGAAKLTVADADQTGDTINLTGELLTVFPMVFDVSATSPDAIGQNLLVTRWGILLADVGYTSIVNSVPATYFFKLKF
jgi:hypothetical protein